jgi:putative restriction endonuclease
MTSSSDFLSRLDRIVVFRTGDQRAPHKPLYLLFCIASLQHGLPRLQEFDKICNVLGEALRRFGPRVASVRPEYPFWRLQHDELAEVEVDGTLGIRSSNTDPKVSSLRKQNACGGLVQGDYNLLLGDLELQSISVHKLLDSHFPASIHDEIVRYFNLKLNDPHSRDVATERDFRESVLSAYGNACALTGYSLDYGGTYLGLEAAHLCWPQDGGNTAISNGIAMTTLHRKLFHLGLFTVNSNYEVQVSKQVRENEKATLSISVLHGRQIALPSSSQDLPNPKNLRWHEKWVFRG